MNEMNSCLTKLKCRECAKEYDPCPSAICTDCLGSLEAAYDFATAAKTLTRESLKTRERNIWRYRELLPVFSEPEIGLNTGFSPLIKAGRLGKLLRLDQLYVKNDAVLHPTLSFKDRVVSVALSRGKEFGFDVFGCASTGNLANAVAAAAAAMGARSYIFIPADLEMGKILGTAVYSPNIVYIDGNYDDVNRLCSEIAYSYKWGFVNVNLRAFYSEGSKTYGFEILEQMDFQAPRNIVIPMASGSLLTKINKAFEEFRAAGLVEGEAPRLFGAQAKGCAPISTAVKSNSEEILPVKPKTIAKSIAIGNPADGYYARDVIMKTDGWAEDVEEEEVVEGIRMLAETEGIFTETAGGVTVAVLKKLAEQGRIRRDETTVLCVTGNGLKTAEVLYGDVKGKAAIKPDIAEFKRLIGSE